MQDERKKYFIEIVVFTKANGPLTKRIEIVDGKVVSDGAPCRMGRGRARRVRLAGLADLAPLIERLDSNQAIGLGALRGDLGDEVEIATKNELADAPRAGAIARTAANIRYVEGEPAIGLFDYDTKDMPPEIAAKVEALGGFWGALVSVLPPLGGAGRVVRRSTSSGLSNTETGETYPGSSGVHVFCEEEDAGDTERFLRTLHDRCWLAGLGWHAIGKAGQLLERSIVDRGVGQGERLVFEGPPTLVPPLSQDRASRRPEFYPGEPIDTKAACPPLTADEERRVAALKAESARRLEPERKEVREAYLDAEARNLVGHRKGMTLAEARATVEKRVGGILLPDQILPWDDPDALATVGDVLDHPDAFEGETLADPIEGVEYGTGKATVMIGREDGVPFVNSFAHGGVVYRLCYDARAIRERIEKASDKPDMLARLLLAADVDAVEEELIIKEVAKAAGVSVTAIRAKIRETREERNQRGDADVEADVERLNETYALVIVGDKTAVMKTSTEEEGVQLLTVSAFNTWHENQFVLHGNRRVPLGKLWLAHSNRRQYEGLVFAPNRDDVPGYYNLWQGFAVEPREGDCSKFLAHVKDNVCNGNDQLNEWVIGWFAQIFQSPADKYDTSLVLRGKQGVGKTKVGDVIGSLLGGHYRLVAEPRYVTGRFNSHMAQLLLLHADEAFWAGDRSAEGKLKDMISGKRHPIEFKGKEVIWIANYVRLFVTGNPNWLVPTGWEERRFGVLDVGEKHMRDYNYFAAIDAEMNNGGREALLYFLLNFDLGKIKLREIPKTKALLDQKMESFTPDQSWWYDVLQRGELPGDLKNGCDCPKHLLHDDYLRRMERLGRRGPPRSTQTVLGMFLSKMVGSALDPNVRNEAGRYVYRFPPLKECRARFAELTGHAIAWSNPNAVWEKEPM